MGTPSIRVENNGSIRTLVLSRPEKRNALTPDMLIRIYELLNEYSADDAAHIVVITGTGDKAFSSGYDITQIPNTVSPELKELLDKKSPFELAIDSIVHYPYPVIAMINGFAFGGAFDLVMSCDIRIGADDVQMGMVPAKLGLVYFPDGLQRFIRTVGWSAAKEMFFTGRRYSAEKLKEMGALDYVVPRNQLASFTHDLAREITENAPLAIKGMKRIFNLIAESGQLTATAKQEANDLIQEAFTSEDAKEGRAAFLEKRKPNFKGLGNNVLS